MNPYSPPTDMPNAYRAAPPYAQNGGGGVTDATMDLLRQTRPWVVLLGVLALIGSGLMFLFGLLAAIAGLVMPNKGMTAALGLAYVPLALLYVYPGIKLWRYGNAIARLTTSRSTSDLEEALGHQKSFWKFAGIASLVLIVVYVIGIVVVVAMGAVAAAGLGKVAP